VDLEERLLCAVKHDLRAAQADLAALMNLNQRLMIENSRLLDTGGNPPDWSSAPPGNCYAVRDYSEQGFWYGTPGASCSHCSGVMGLVAREQIWSAACCGCVSRM